MSEKSYPAWGPQSCTDPACWYIIANPAARRGAMGRAWPDIERIFQELEIPFTVRFTEYRGHAMQLAEDAVLAGAGRIMAIGGDGTNHETVHGLFTQQHRSPVDITYALLPFGTGNDWARQYQLPFEPRARLQRLVQPETVLQDIGLVEYTRDGATHRRYFVNVAGMAYDGFITWKLLKRPARNKTSYLLAVGRYLMEYVPSKARIIFNGRTVEDEFYTINIGLCRYSGGGMQLVPHAVPDDGLLALTFARKLPKLEVLLQSGRFYKGTLLEHPRIEGYQTDRVRVEASGSDPCLVEADGEFLGHTPVEFSLLPAALKLAL